VAIDRVVGKAGQAIGETKAEEIGGHTVELVEVFDHPPPEKAPGGAAMEQQQGAIPTSAGVDKVEPASRVVVSREGQTTSIEGKKRDPAAKRSGSAVTGEPRWFAGAVVGGAFAGAGGTVVLYRDFLFFDQELERWMLEILVGDLAAFVWPQMENLASGQGNLDRCVGLVDNDLHVEPSGR
jgi:hypothetical protein